MTDPGLTVVIVNWNHVRHLEACLAALFQQDYPDFEVVLVDNHSTDGSVEWVTGRYPAVRLICNPVNLGFSQALNDAIHQTTAPFILSLNPDVTLRPGFLCEIMKPILQDERVGMVAPKLLQADHPERLDSTGLFIDRRRRPWDRGQGRLDCGRYGGAVFGACGGAALYRRAMLADVAPGGEYFDVQFFAYYEDADISWRAQMRGWKAMYAPLAEATHVRGKGDTLKNGRGRGPRLALRNRYLMVIKNDTPGSFLRDLPWIAAAELPRLAYATLMNPGVWLGWIDLWRAIPAALQKRRQIRSRRLVDDRELRRWLLARDGPDA